MSRKCLEHMLDELEFSNFTNYQKWYSNLGHVCYTLPDLCRDYRAIRRNQYDFYPNDYNRQIYWMPQSFFPSYEPFHFLRWNDKRYLPNKIFQYTREKRNFRENKFYQNREEKETNLRVDRVRRDFISQFERRFQSNWDHDYTAPSYQVSRDGRNPARLSFRNSIDDLCAEDNTVDQSMKMYKQAFDNSSSTECLTLKEDQRQSRVCENKYADSNVGVNYSGSSAVEWQGKGTKFSNTIPSDGASYVTASDFSSSYESWYCPEEQQQIIDMLKEVNMRHDRQLQRDKLISSEDTPCSDESISSNNDFNTLEKSLSSDDEEIGINIILSPKGERPVPNATSNEAFKLNSEYFEKSSSDLFEEFQNIFTGSPEKEIFNKLTKESMKVTANAYAESINDSELNSAITSNDKDAVKSVLNFDNLDDLPEKTLANFRDATYFSREKEDSSTQKLTSGSKSVDKSCRIKLPTATKSEQLPLKENVNPCITEIPILASHITQNTTKNNDFNKESLDEKSPRKYNILPKENISSEQQENTKEISNDINCESGKVLECCNFIHSDNHLHRSLKHGNKPKQNSPSKEISNIKYFSKNVHSSGNRYRHKLQQQSSYYERTARKYYPQMNTNNSVMTKNFNENPLIMLQSDISSKPKNNYTFNHKESIKTYNDFNVENKRPKVNRNEKVKKTSFSSSDPNLHYEGEKTVYKRISVSEIFKNSNVNSSKEMEILEERQTHVRQFIEQSENHTSLSPSEHLKLILGIGIGAKELNIYNNVQPQSRVNCTSNCNQLPGEIFVSNSSNMLGFNSSESDGNKTSYFTKRLCEASMSHKYPCCISTSRREDMSDHMNDSTERMKTCISNINSYSTRMNVPTYESKTNMEIKPEADSEVKFVIKPKLVHGCKTCEINSCFEKNSSHNSCVTDTCKAITYDCKPDYLYDGYNDEDNTYSKLESKKKFNNQKQNLKCDAEVSERSSSSMNYGLVNSSKKNSLENESKSTLLGDESKMNYFVEKKAKRNVQYCSSSFEFNSSQGITENIVNVSNLKAKSILESPTIKKRFKKKKKKEMWLEKCKTGKYMSKTYSSNDRLAFEIHPKQSQISILSVNDSKETPQIADGHIWEIKNPDTKIDDERAANFTTITHDKMNANYVDKNVEFILNEEEDEITQNRKQTNDQGSIYEFWNPPEKNYHKMSEIRNNLDTREGKSKAFKAILKNSKAKEYNFTKKHEFNEAGEKPGEKVKFSENKIIKFKQCRTSYKKKQFVFNDSHCKVPAKIMIGSIKCVSKSFNKINKEEINTIITEENSMITGKHLDDECQLNRKGNEKYYEPVSITITDHLSVKDISVGNNGMEISYLKHNEKNQNLEHSTPTKTSNKKKGKGSTIESIVMLQTRLLNSGPVIYIKSLRNELKKQVGEGKDSNSIRNTNSCVRFYNEDQKKNEKNDDSNLPMLNAKRIYLIKFSKIRNFEILVCNNKVYIKLASTCQLPNGSTKSVISRLLEIFYKYSISSFQLCFHNQNKYEQDEEQRNERYSIVFKSKNFKLESVINKEQENDNKNIIALIIPNSFHFRLRNTQMVICHFNVSPFPNFCIQMQMETNQFSINAKSILHLLLNSMVTENLSRAVSLFIRSSSILSALNLTCCQKYLKEVSKLAHHDDNKKDENKILVMDKFKGRCTSEK